MTDPSLRYLTLSQVAARTGRHPELLRQWCAAGRIPCERLGGSWVIREDDLALIDRMATRARRHTAQAQEASGRRRLLAAVFDNREHADLATAALGNRLEPGAASVESAPVGLPALAALGLTVIASHVAEESVLDARRIVASFGGRVVAEFDDAGSPASPAPRPPRARQERRRAQPAG